MKRIDWQQYVPLGIDGKRSRNYLLLALTAGAAASLRFLSRYHNAKKNLYEWTGRKWVLIDDAVMPYFSQLLHGSFWGLTAVAACMPVIVLLFYLYHYQGSRSIYTMRRLPNRRELWRRCLTLPVLTIFACLVLAAVLTALYLGIYLWATPDICLPPGLWQTI